MDVVKTKNLQHKLPSSATEDGYPYSSSAKVFHTDQLFLYSEKVAPGRCASAPHFHTEVDEIIYITKGELYAYEGDEQVILNVGESVCFYKDSKKKHYLENKSDVEAEFLIFRKSLENLDVIY